MSFRSPISILNRDALLGLENLKGRLSTLQTQISSGRRIVRVADDPAGSALIVDLSASIKANQQFMKAITDALGFQSTTETALTTVSDQMTRLMELGEQALNGTNGAANRATIAAEVDGLRTNFLTYANTQAQGKYIFAGTQTQTVPFSGPSAGPIVYAGDANVASVAVSASSSAPLNVPGSTVFFGTGGQGSATDLFQQVTAFRDALLANNVAGIQTALTNLKGIQDRINTAVTDIGGQQAALRQLQTDLDGFNVSLQSIQNNVQDLDYPKAITEFTAAQTAQQAALSTLSRVSTQNLFNFLG